MKKSQQEDLGATERAQNNIKKDLEATNKLLADMGLAKPDSATFVAVFQALVKERRDLRQDGIVDSVIAKALDAISTAWTKSPPWRSSGKA